MQLRDNRIRLTRVHACQIPGIYLCHADRTCVTYKQMHDRCSWIESRPEPASMPKRRTIRWIIDRVGVNRALGCHESAVFSADLPGCSWTFNSDGTTAEPVRCRQKLPRIKNIQVQTDTGAFFCRSGTQRWQSMPRYKSSTSQFLCIKMHTNITHAHNESSISQQYASGLTHSVSRLKRARQCNSLINYHPLSGS